MNNGTANDVAGVTHWMIGDRCRTCRCPAPICDGIASREGQPCCGSCDHVSAPAERPVLRLIQDTAPLDNLAGPCGTCAATFSDCVLDPGLCCVGCDHETQPARPNLRLIQGGAP